MKILSHLLSALLLASPCIASENEELLIRLQTSSALQSVYIGKIQSKSATFDSKYLTEIQTVLDFDFDHNGATKVLPRSTEKELLLQKTLPAEALNPEAWKNFGATFAIRCQVAQRTLTFSVLNAQTGSIKTFSAIELTGDLKHDRRQIHKLADAVHQALFHTDGIANTRILYAYQSKTPQADGKGWVSEIWECDWDGANARQLTHDNSYSVTPVSIPENAHYRNDSFLYVSYKMGQPKIYLGSLKGGQGKRLIDLRGNQLLPAISAQRDKLAFICDAGGRTDLFLQPMNPKTGEVGKPVQLFSYPRSTQASPTFSPDGSQVAFVSDKDGGVRIFIIPTAISEKRANAKMITIQNRESSCPAWSPDGTKLAYSAKTENVRQIWVYDFGTQEEWQLTSGPGNKENPSWAPDSLHLVFNSSDGSDTELYIANLNQPEAIKISRGSGKKHYPSWGK